MDDGISIDDSYQSQEKGILTSSNGVTQFIGSASGIHFLNTVKAALLVSERGNDIDEIDEQVIAGERHVESAALLSNEIEVIVVLPFELVQKLCIPYFKYLHPLFPFLNGNEFRSDLNALRKAGTSIPTIKSCIFRAVFSIGVLEYPELGSTVENLIFKGPSEALSYIGLLAAKYDMLSIQSLLALQVYLLSAMSVRNSYQLSGLIRTKLYAAGFHRCPARYGFDLDECNQRKRIYWSAYALDRHICQTLGLPLGIQDSDVDVCSLIAEKHIYMGDISIQALESNEHDSPVRIGASYAAYGTLIGQVVELFNKSVHMRHIDASKVLELKSKIEAWRNRLPDDIITDPNSPFENTCFFDVIYYYIIILVNRPRLSLTQTNAEFRYAIEVCIDCSRSAILKMTDQINQHPDQSLFWPGYLSTVWSSGLMLAYACRIGTYPYSKASKEIGLCLPLCDEMAKRWPIAEKCRQMLETIMIEIAPSRKRAREPDPSSPEVPFDSLENVFELFSTNWQWME